jgi:hypothetical protein
MASSSGGRILGAVGAVVVTACGAGTPVAPASLPEKIDVRVSAGAPVAGAVVTVYAISDVTGLPDGSVGAGGVIGSAGPTDSSGRATVSLASRGYSGPVQVVASGSSMSYPDPSAAQGGAANSVIQVPATFALSSYVARFTGAAPVVPVTLLTTLADRAALAWARGRHPAQRTPTTITAALTARDPLFVAHVTKDPAAWNPASLRSTVPADLTDGPHTLVDAAYAALLDLGLNRLARDEAAKAGSSAVTAVVLAQLLQDDLDADGRFDGRGVGGLLLAIPGNPPIALDDQTLRVPLAQGLDEWIRDVGANKSGIGQADLVSAKVYDALTTDASDLFGGPPAPGVFDPVDRTPPVLAFATAPPAYTNQTTLALQILATDATGVQGVFAASGTKQFTAVQGASGVWTLSIDLLPGHNPITVWGQDSSQAANSGLGGPEPYQHTLDVLLDTSPPTAIYDASVASYATEQGVGIATAGDGAAIVPAHALIGARKAIQVNGEIFKMASTLSAGSMLDAVELEATNARNLPFLRFAVPHDPNLQSPITVATFSIQVSCTNCAFPTRNGDLLASPNAAPGFLFFDLPLSTETVPDLAAVTGTASVVVTLTLEDAAGNVSRGVDGGTYSFHVLGPALAVAEDTSYATSGDPRSTFMYAAAAPSYAALFDPAAASFLPDKQVRLVKYMITNPWPAPALADVSLLGGAWGATETWRGEMLRMPTLAYSADGMSFSGTTDWAATCDGFATFPCGGAVTDQDTKYPIHFAGSTTQYTCDTKPGVANSTSPWATAPVDLVGTQQASAAAELRAFSPGAPWDATPAQTVSGLYVVPAATATAPGRLDVYVTRPAGVSARTVPLAFGTLNPSSPVARFEQWEWDHWMDTDPTKVACTFRTFTIIVSCSICGSTSVGCLPCAVPITVTNSYQHWWSYRSIRYLAAAADNVSGSLSVSSFGLSVDGAKPVGEASVQASSVSVQRSILH